MKSPVLIACSKIGTILLLLSFCILPSCLTPSDKDGNGVPDDEDWNEKIPDELFEENEDRIGITHLRNPTEMDIIEKESGTGRKHFDKYDSSYDLLHADETINLPAELSDITGLSIAPEGDGLIATNFRDGEIHFIDFDGELDKTTWFKRRGKYTGIEAVRSDIFIAKENGSIFHISELHSTKPKRKVFNTLLNAKHKVHGLCYNPIQNELLLVCQGNGDDKSTGESKSIFAFDLDRKELLRQPLFFIENEDIMDYLEYFHPKTEDDGEALFYDIPVTKPFIPSAIAIHPSTDEIYLVSSSSMQLVILSDDGDLLYVEQLDPFVFSRPEGMCFDLDGTLYMSSKGGKGSSGKIMRFDPQRRNRHPS